MTHQVATGTGRISPPSTSERHPSDGPIFGKSPARSQTRRQRPGSSNGSAGAGGAAPGGRSLGGSLSASGRLGAGGGRAGGGISPGGRPTAGGGGGGGDRRGYRNSSEFRRSREEGLCQR